MNKVKSKQVTPKVFLLKDTENIYDCIKTLLENKAIIVNISSLDVKEKYRVIDFLSGYIFALKGSREKLEDNIYIFSL